MKQNFTVRQGAPAGVEAFLSVAQHRSFRRRQRRTAGDSVIAVARLRRDDVNPASARILPRREAGVDGRGYFPRRALSSSVMQASRQAAAIARPWGLCFLFNSRCITTPCSIIMIGYAMG